MDTITLKLKRAVTFAVALSLFFGTLAVPARAETVSGKSGSASWSYNTSNSTLTLTGSGATESYAESDKPWVKVTTQKIPVKTTPVSAEKVIKIAESQIGYREKKSNSNLDSMTGNQGYKNYTKYARDLFPHLQANPWCDMFVKWCVYKASGESKSLANKVVCGGLGSAYTPTSANKYKAAKRWTTTDPKVGDQIFFRNSKRICHTGIVYKVTDKYVYTIEGNTSSDESKAYDGGRVMKKTYARSASKIAGYGHPIYSTTVETQEEQVTKSALSIKTVVISEGITSLGKYLFNDKAEMKTITIPESVKTISANAFNDCTGITEVIYNGSEDSWKKISVDSTGNSTLINAKKTFKKQSETKPVETKPAEPKKEDGKQEESKKEEATQTKVLKIALQPVSATVPANTLHEFRIKANITSDTKYQWQVKESSKKDWRNFTEKKTAKTDVLNFTVTKAMNGWKLRCVITNGKQSVTSKTINLTVTDPLKITEQPADAKKIQSGTIRRMRVAVTPAKNVTYQWQVKKSSSAKWVNYDEKDTAKTAVLGFTVKKSMSGWKFRCVITNNLGEKVTSRAATLTVK